MSLGRGAGRLYRHAPQSNLVALELVLPIEHGAGIEAELGDDMHRRTGAIRIGLFGLQRLPQQDGAYPLWPSDAQPRDSPNVSLLQGAGIQNIERAGEFTYRF